MKTAIYRKVFTDCKKVIESRRELCRLLAKAKENQHSYMIQSLEESIENVDCVLSMAITARYVSCDLITAYNGVDKFWSKVHAFCAI